MIQFYEFLNEIRRTSTFYDKKYINKYTEDFYNDYPCSTKKDLLDNYKNCLNKDIININDDFLINSIISVEDLSRNHDKHVLLGKEKVYVETTSGSTGKPLAILKTNKTRIIESRYLIKCRKRINQDVSLNNGFLIIHGSDRNLINLDIRNDKEIYKDYDRLLFYFLKNNPKWAFSTVLIAKRFFSYIQETIGFDDFRKKSNLLFFETTSQSFSNEEKKNYSELLGTKLVNNYGCREVWNIAYECPYGHLHVNNEYLLVSIIDDDNQIIEQDGVIGRVIITSFINKLFPIIKYLIGDYAKMYKHHECKCGNKSPIIILEKGRPFERIKYTDFYGNDIFKRVLRGIYFHESIKDFDDIKIIQKDKMFEIYVKGELSEKFKEEFEHITKFLLKTDIFTYNFHKVTDFDLLNMKNADKDFLFRCEY